MRYDGFHRCPDAASHQQVCVPPFIALDIHLYCANRLFL